MLLNCLVILQKQRDRNSLINIDHYRISNVTLSRPLFKSLSHINYNTPKISNTKALNILKHLIKNQSVFNTLLQ